MTPTSPSLRQLFSENFDVPITQNTFRAIEGYCLHFETKGTHPLALNSPYLGVQPVYFTSPDQRFIFDLVNVDYHDVARVIGLCKSVNKNFIVSSDTYNLFTIWLCYLANKSTLPTQTKDAIVLYLLKLLHYKFFTSFVKHSYPYGADEQTMQRALEGMSAKFDIKKTETSTWRLLLEARCKELISSKSIHYTTFQTFMPDAKILYAISDIQTRIRNQIKLVNQEYYRCKKDDDKVGSYGLSTTIEGEQVIKTVDAIFDQMFSELSTSAHNPSKFIDSTDLNLVCKLTGNIKVDLIRTMLMKFCDMASLQSRSNQGDLQTIKGKETLYVGYRILLKNLLQNTYSVLARTGEIDFKNKAEVLIKVQNLYRSSRITDPGILSVKNSVSHMLDEFNLSRREATLSYLKISFIVYVILRSFKSL